MLAAMSQNRQNLTISLDPAILRKARILAARDRTSISSLVAGQITRLVGEDEAYRRARRRALALLQTPFHLGGTPASREEWHERP